MEINKKAIIISLITILLIGSIFLVFSAIKPIPFVSAISLCTGEPASCEGMGQSQCNTCGCDWIEEIARKLNIGDDWKTVTGMKINIAGDICTGYPDACSSHGSEAACTPCGCIWTYIDPIWECTGAPSACSSYGEGDCEACGCGWNVESWKTVTDIYINIGNAWKTMATGTCGGDPSFCSVYGEGDCEYCGCFWSP